MIFPPPQNVRALGLTPGARPFVHIPGKVQFIVPDAWKNDFTESVKRRLALSDTPFARKIEIVQNARIGYGLLVDGDTITLFADTYADAVWGMQSLLQLYPASIYQSPLSERVVLYPQWIEDAPVYAYRGVHLDCARHFFTIPEIKKFIDLLSMHKMNVFHWHLTDDQGWRFEIKKFPKLTQQGAVRAASPKMWKRLELDGKKYGPYFYTQDEAREIVRYAKARGVEVIPEIEMPGHAQAALAAYPHYGCTGKKMEPWCHWGVSENVYCAGNDDTLTFLKSILDEVMSVFDSKYIHVGGDECPKTLWKTCPKCQARMKKMKLKNEEELQSWFVTQIGNYLVAHGKTMIGWDEILEGGIPPESVVMSWRGSEGGKTAAQAQHEVVMTPNTHLYFDYGQGPQKDEPEFIFGFIPLEKVYEYDPDEGLDAAAPYVLGAQANCWSEYLFDFSCVEYALLPRLAALSEILWSYPEVRDFNDFKARLQPLLLRYDAMKLNYRKLNKTK